MGQTGSQAIKNSTPDIRSVIYDFGIKRSAPNCKDILDDDLWKNRLLNKWIYTQDTDRNHKIFIKHTFNGKRVMQTIYSGEDIYGDGLYKIYSAKVIYKQGSEDFIIDPIKFSLMYGSFSFPGEGLLDELIKDGYISEKEKATLSNKILADSFANSLYRMPDRL